MQRQHFYLCVFDSLQSWTLVFKQKIFFYNIHFSILNCCLLHIENEALVRSELPADRQMTLTHILEKFVLSWQQEEQKRREAEDEAASLYRFKSQVHGDERSEEEKLEQEFRENFPLFEQVWLCLDK